MILQIALHAYGTK